MSSEMRELIARWRHNAQGCSRKEAHAAGTWRSCARELEAALLARTEAGAVNVTPGLIEALGYQQQCDEDGTMCIVSRQAVDEARSILSRLDAASVVDGKKKHPFAFYNADTGRFFWLNETEGAPEPVTGVVNLYTHPHDASAKRAAILDQASDRVAFVDSHIWPETVFKNVWVSSPPSPRRPRRRSREQDQ
jgi:hypothetical protein